MVCDSSVLVASLVPEPSSRSVLAALRKGSGVVSDFAVGEVCSAISIKVRHQQLAAAEANAILNDFELWTDRFVKRVTLQPEDMRQATRIVRRFELGLRMPDALHLALAQRLNTTTATLDQRQAHAARVLGIPLVELDIG